MNTYNTIDLTKENILKSTRLSYPTNQIEKILLVLIAGIGILGSVYIFAASSGSNPSPNYLPAASAATITAVDTEEEDWKGKFGDFIHIEGKKKVGSQLEFQFKGDRSKGRYVLEMGNGNRMIITSKKFPFTYSIPGKYTLELKKIERGLITTLATKKIKIKK